MTRRAGNTAIAGLVIGLALNAGAPHRIPMDGASVNPARSLGPSLFVGSSALDQLWAHLVAPLVGGGLSALVYDLFYRKDEEGASPEEQAR